MTPRERPRPDRVEFRLNEPPKPVQGGIWRESVVVDRDALPELRRRERLNRILLAHDPEVAAANLTELTGEDLELLRQIATEGVVAGVEPAIRKNAIACLGRFPTVENLNLLADLARSGEDAYVRGYALWSLGQAGVELAIPLLRDGLAARDDAESRRAELGLVALGRALGAERLRFLTQSEKRKRVVAKLKRVFEALEVERPREEKPRAPRSTRED